MERAVEIRSVVVGPVQENAYIVRPADGSKAVIVDPGEEPERIIGIVKELGVDVEAILVTHCHFDHVGAVAPVARATGAEVFVSEAEKPVLADIMRFVPWSGLGPFESHEAERTLVGGEHLELAGFGIDVLATPGHSPGHLTYSIPSAKAIFCGDVLFQGSVGRVDLPGGDWRTLSTSIQALLDELPPETRVFSGHGNPTTLGDEARTNPFLKELGRPL